MRKEVIVILALLFISNESQAIIIIPIPNLGFPPTLSKIRDALEKSTDTKALATVGEDKTFGTRFWVWAHSAGKMTQVDADADALRKCEAQLHKTISETAGAQPLYDFGNKRCELYKFTNVTLNLPVAAAPATVSPPAPAPVLTLVAPIAAPSVVTVPLTSNSEPPVVAVSPAVIKPTTEVPSVSASRPQDSPLKSNNDIVSKMRDLDALYKQSLVTKDEYEKKKKQLLDAL